MSEGKQYTVGLVKSIIHDYTTGQTRGVIETVNDNEDSELPFVVTNSLLMDLEKGKMVKFVKEKDSLVPRAVDVDKL